MDASSYPHSRKIGAVLVVGAGIGGMQASLDLVQAGFKVYLLDKEGTIGGTMSQLDKTFPTNDCAMCIMSPKLVEVARDRNIEIIPFAELLGVEGEAGRFTVRVLRHPRRVDPDKCTGCGLCQQHCPLEAASEYNQGLTRRKAIFIDYPQAVPTTHRIDRRQAPCRIACPLKLPVPEYVGLIASGEFAKSLALIREHLPFPATIGRVCTRPCEEACVRGREMEEPIAICQLKRFVADQEIADPRTVPVSKPEKRWSERVAVVGGGPAGLTAAWVLAREGYPVTIFEAGERLGGMLRGIPGYRLPEETLDREIQAVIDHGIEVRCNARVGRDFPFESLQGEMGYGAVFLGVGAWEGMQLKIPGEEAEGVLSGVKFLESLNSGQPATVEGRVAVIGGGNVAVDAARSALRLGASEVSLYYRRTRAEMPAHSEEIHAAVDEGVRMHFLVAPVKILVKAGKVSSLELIRMKLGPPDASGRRRPVPIPGSETRAAADIVIPAIGQGVALPFEPLRSGVQTTGRRTLAVDPVTGATSVPGVFAGGDAGAGANIAIGAMADGVRAAESIHRYLRSRDLAEGRDLEERFLVEQARPGFARMFRERMPLTVMPERLNSFEEVEVGFSPEQAMREASRCLNCRACLGCGICGEVCEAKAVDYAERERLEELEVGSIVLAPGFEEYDPSGRGEYGYGRYENVVTSIEYERMLSATGPFGSMPLRPSDGDIPQKIAWIQCVGSRDQDHDYCSSVCCMAATKEAVITREHLPFVEATIFYLDLRAHGKGFDLYCERAREMYQVRYVRSQISRIVEDPRTRNLKLCHVAGDGTVTEEEFHLVVLSVGMCPRPETRELASRIGIELDPHGFCRTDPFRPLASSRPGVYVCGAFQSPKDIPETVAQASGAAAFAATEIAEARGALLHREELPREKDVADAEPRVGVFVCNCGVNIGSVVNVPEVSRYAAGLPGVVHSEEHLFSCSSDSLKGIREAIEAHDLNRVVVASCSPRTHEVLFRQAVREARLNPFLFEMANIRDQCSWVHGHQQEEATRKAKELVGMAVARARSLAPLQLERREVNRKSLVVGGGLSGMSAALGLADQGYEVFLVEKEPELGGNLRRLHRTIDGKEVKALCRDLVERVMNHPRVEVFTGAELVDHGGSKGNFRTGIVFGPDREHRQLEHGVTLLATGAEEWKPDIYQYGRDARVITQQEFEAGLAEGTIDPAQIRQVVMIQCVGSRVPERPYCSRVCCSTAVKNALWLKEHNPTAQVSVLYRDLRTYGMLEEYYTRARQQGVLFLPYDLERRPEVSTDAGRLMVTTFDPTVGRRVRFTPDLVVLSAAVVPRDNARVARLFKVSRTFEGFFLEAHVKLKPVDFAAEGVFMAGMAHGPKPIPECLSQAAAAVARACTVIGRDWMEVGGMVARVEPEKCAACLICVRACPYGVPSIHEEGYAVIDSAHCQGCGTCAGECPQKAIELQHYTDRQMLDKGMALAGRHGLDERGL